MRKTVARGRVTLAHGGAGRDVRVFSGRAIIINCFHGVDALQLSVFSCDLTPAQRIKMIAALEEAIDREADQVLLIDLGPSQVQPIHQIEALGRPLAVRERGPIVL